MQLQAVLKVASRVVPNFCSLLLAVLVALPPEEVYKETGEQRNIDLKTCVEAAQFCRYAALCATVIGVVV
jgi:hypothetical protein